MEEEEDKKMEDGIAAEASWHTARPEEDNHAVQACWVLLGSRHHYGGPGNIKMNDHMLIHQ